MGSLGTELRFAMPKLPRKRSGPASRKPSKKARAKPARRTGSGGESARPAGRVMRDSARKSKFAKGKFRLVRGRAAPR